MSSAVSRATIDHFLIAKVEARATGANAHDVHSLLGAYYGFAEAADDPACSSRVQAIELRLRVFCQTGEL